MLAETTGACSMAFSSTQLISEQESYLSGDRHRPVMKADSKQPKKFYCAAKSLQSRVLFFETPFISVESMHKHPPITDTPPP